MSMKPGEGGGVCVCECVGGGGCALPLGVVRQPAPPVGFVCWGAATHPGRHRVKWSFSLKESSERRRPSGCQRKDSSEKSPGSGGCLEVTVS